MITVRVDQFSTWRAWARQLLRRQIPPDQVEWLDIGHGTPGVDGRKARAWEKDLDSFEELHLPLEAAVVHRVPERFLKLAEVVALHRDPGRWSLLYQAAWRLTHGEQELLEAAADADVQTLTRMKRAVRRAANRMTRSIVFRRCAAEDTEYSVAWHEPAHPVLRLAAPALLERFPLVRWAVLTPDESAYWDGHVLHFGPGVARKGKSLKTGGDQTLSRVWQEYYAAAFDPARLKLPKRKQSTNRPLKQQRDTPPDKMRASQTKLLERMRCGDSPRGTLDFLPVERDLPSLTAAARTCHGCDLWCHATQTVFGRGPSHAPLVFVGGQPGERDDLFGQPFVGPAGEVLDEALAAVGIDRKDVYVTNAVKHFKWAPRGSRRVHAKPNARQVEACRPWLEAELEAIKPRLLVCLGATAAQALLGADFRITQQHGQVFNTRWAPWTTATYSPSALLRVPDETVRAQMHEQFLYDLRRVAEELRRPQNAEELLAAVDA